MALHLQDQGSWKKADEVWVNDSDTWKQCNEVYIKENDVWKPVLYEPGTAYFTESGVFNVPVGVSSITVVIAGGAGGAGGGDGGAGSVGGGNGMTVVTSIPVTLGEGFSFVIGKKGGDGKGYQNRAAGGIGGAGYSIGGNGGRAGNQGSSGGGGGGGGSTSFNYQAPGGWEAMYIIAAGGSGAGGRGNNVHYSVADIHGKSATQIQTVDSTGVNGGGGISCPCRDGGAGGGGGGGVNPQATGGLYYGGATTCLSGYYDADGMPGEAATSFWTTVLTAPTTNSGNTGDGYVSISW